MNKYVLSDCEMDVHGEAYYIQARLMLLHNVGTL